MDDHALYQASVPVFRHYIGRMAVMIETVSEAALEARLADDAFSAGLNFRIAQGYVFRIVCPLMGRETPELPMEGHGRDALKVNGAAALEMLDSINVQDFDGASGRLITHEAGFARLEQSATEFLTLYGMPNFFFHLVNAYAALRKNGENIGKSDFDGMHSYPPGFSF